MMGSHQQPTVAVINLVKDLSSSLKEYDALVIITTSLDEITKFIPHSVTEQLHSFKEFNSKFNDELTFSINDNVPGKRLIYSPTGVIDRDYDDVRRFGNATLAGVKKALSVGAKSPLIACFDPKQYQQANLVILLAALEATYVPLQIREDVSERRNKVDRLGLFIGQTSPNDDYNEKLINYARAVELGRVVGRDIGGADPERMTPPRVAEYIRELFAQSPTVTVDIIDDQDKFKSEYPLFAAVNRAANSVERHRGRLISLEYKGKGEIDSTVLFVGKGITYDTGGLDIKAGGHMAGMSYDKCGAANVAGFFKVLSELKPKNFKAIGMLAVARNSCGEEGYVADEVLTTRAGVRIRVGNTDAEGRMVMADPLCHMKELALKEINPHLFTIATLTGHVARAYGQNYTAVIDNGPAQDNKTAQQLQTAGDKVGDPFEISTVRQEDFDFICDKSEVADLLQCNNEPSSATPRGHQFPAAFLARASGLDQHGRKAKQPLRYTHFDIGGSAGELPQLPTGRPIPALCQMLIAHRVL